MKFIKSQTNRFTPQVSYYPVTSFNEFTISTGREGGRDVWRVVGRRSSDITDPHLATFDTPEEAQASLKQLIAELGDEKRGGSVIFAWPPHYKERQASLT